MSEQYIYGIHAVEALLGNPRRLTRMLFINQDRIDERIEPLLLIAAEKHIRVARLSLQKLNQRFPDVVHQGIVAAADPLPNFIEHDLESLVASSKIPALILILDGVTDPHNLGACLRSADAAGVDFVVIPKDKNASITAVVSKVACGAAESVPVVKVTNLARAMDVLKHAGVWIYGAAGEAKSSIFALDCSTSVALVMGAEDKGLRHLTRERCDGLFALPMQGSVSSLNVSVATGISLFEVVRQRISATQ